jgi:SPP1 family predicted phage head-tail adaptor
MNIGKLREFVTFQRDIGMSPPTDSYGALLHNWAFDFETWAQVQRVGSKEFPLMQRRHSQTTAKFIIRYRTGIDPALNRILHDGKIWDITDPVPDERRTKLEIEASETK